MLLDSHGRRITYLRVSVTDRCNLRCLYCSRHRFQWLPPEEILTYEEIARVVRVAVELGVERVRLTGGEPLLRRGLPGLIRMLADIEGLRDLSLTTNGVLLSDLASELKAAGLARVNVSLDTLDPEKFKRITGMDALARVLAGVEAALARGLTPVKINTVVVRGLNEEEVPEMARLTLSEPLHLRFIEFMPIGEGNEWEDRFVGLEEVMERVREVGDLLPAEVEGGGPARIFRLPGARGTIGFIAAISRHFCAACNRLRLTPEGRLRLCLFSDREFDLRPYLRREEDLRQALAEAVRLKPVSRAGTRPRRLMRSIGG
ncbi:GTP 3',8-cyclase MoaA [Thermosulfurimonas sp.]|uniref:GTP 3',8-cyclase MoaA n=1 Tax=Thermosulfurimonas sp. TaxID=2080236 RepID=UPI0025D8F33A|nr:GTP 3',8-cyclase MoaA [Thermosulfurimonas sp.]